MKSNLFVNKSKVATGKYVVKNIKPEAGSIVYYTKAELKALHLEIRRTLDRKSA